jgi:hypothetical protein
MQAHESLIKLRCLASGWFCGGLTASESELRIPVSTMSINAMGPQPRAQKNQGVRFATGSTAGIAVSILVWVLAGPLMGFGIYHLPDQRAYAVLAWTLPLTPTLTVIVWALTRKRWRSFAGSFLFVSILCAIPAILLWVWAIPYIADYIFG